ncbi:MAG: NOL1/NOP2/sun family putative RNA methylase [Candidatus Odinarchaeia archaeon]
MDLERLSSDIAEKYGYSPWIVKRYLELFGEKEALELIEANENPVPRSIRVNTLKITVEDLINRLESKGFRFKPIPWIKEGLWVKESPFTLGSTSEYLLGYYFIQTAASMIPPLILNPSKDDLVVDMSAAPGGKTTHIAQIMGNEGVILALDVSRSRMRSLRSQISRCGVENTILFRMNAIKLPELGVKADKILLDAPCTGEGLIPEDPERKTSRSIEDLHVCASIQRQLIDAAAQCIKENGILVYSTCSIAPEENEEIINYALEKYPFRVEKINLNIGEPGLTDFFGRTVDSSISHAVRLYPHKHKTIGFFICKLKFEGD